MKTRLFMISVLTLGLVTIGAVMSFAADTDKAIISATVGGVRDVAMADLTFASPLAAGYHKAESDLAFYWNYSSVLRIWTANSPAVQGMAISGTETNIELRYNFDIGGTDSPTPTETNWTTDWILVADNPAELEKNVLYTADAVDKSAGGVTLDFATEVELTTAPGDYSTELNLEIVTP